jgi:ribA/ribD-fused uncharacterized protein
VEHEPYDRATLVEWIRGGYKPSFLFFWGHSSRHDAIGKECLSQWYPSSFEIDGTTYPTAEHYMMWRKALLFGDAQSAEAIASAKSPAEAKKLGRAVRNFDSELWEQHRFEIVRSGSYAKFSQNSALRAFLTGTRGRVLVEASPHDTIWGIGVGEEDSRAYNPARWPGLNVLGFALMRARASL